MKRLVKYIIAAILIAFIIPILFSLFDEKINSAPVSITSDWKTYVDPYYGFEFKYPKKWNTVSNCLADFTVYAQIIYFNPDMPSCLSGKDNVKASGSISVYQADDTYSGVPVYNVLVNSFKNDNEKIIEQDILVNNINVKKLTKIVNTGSGTTIYEDLIFQHGSTIFDIYAEGIFHGNKTLEIFDQILSTFKFIK